MPRGEQARVEAAEDRAPVRGFPRHPRRGDPLTPWSPLPRELPFARTRGDTWGMPVAESTRRFVRIPFLRLFAMAWALASAPAAPVTAAAAAESGSPLLGMDRFQAYLDAFNRDDEELYPQAVRNADAGVFLERNVPRFECPEADLERTYWFRWWTYRKHVKATPDGFVITEFLPPVPWAGKHNTISCAAGHHLYEGRWLRDPQMLDQYARFWFRGGGDPRRYSFWAADALSARARVTGDTRLPRELLPDLVANYEGWEKSRYDAEVGLFWQEDGQDGMEVSVGGTGYRVTINSYQYGDALAIARLAELAGQPELAARFRTKAADLKRKVIELLWDPAAGFFKVLPRGAGKVRAEARELHGLTPWYFGLADQAQALAWKQFADPRGFQAPFGLTTTEQRHPGFALAYAGHECQWNGPSWPYATAVTLTAAARFLDGPTQDALRVQDYFDALRTYARAHRLTRDDGRVVPWIDENLNPRTGDWIARTRLKTWSNGTWSADKGGRERGKDYNHSTFCDLVISGLVGLHPREDEVIEVRPLIPEGVWDYFALDQVAYHGRTLTILWDRTGTRYQRGAGLQVLVDGRSISMTNRLTRLEALLPASTAASPNPSPAASPSPAVADSGAEAAAGWRKYEGNPVLGGALGTCFDVALLREEGRYRMWFSWRPKKSLARVESKDGIRWGEPTIVLGPNPRTEWEEDINRPVVVKRDDGYHLWYTGQAKDHSWIGYATSQDGLQWERRSERPVLSPEQPWEKVAVMCPHVEWEPDRGEFRMWYSGGDQYEPDAIGLATSRDGLNWVKHSGNPVFQGDPRLAWEHHKVTAAQVVRRGDWYLLFYIGFRDVDHAQIGLARSRDGITGWERHPANPILRPGEGRWDHDACYKPFAIFDGQRWLLWYNGRHGGSEQIGLATHLGEDLGF